MSSGPSPVTWLPADGPGRPRPSSSSPHSSTSSPLTGTPPAPPAATTPCATPSPAADRRPLARASNSAPAPACSPPLLTASFPHVISVDLSLRMLQQAHGRSPVRIQADASTLPLPDSSVTAIAAIDMLLFPTETARVLTHHGALLWINQLGSDGPLYLPAADVAAALPGTWQPTESEAGWGSWAVLRRTR
ncbi:methyltransferase domain-containing protein [Streptomyces rishiriensis]|uniref:methyltransferase domain-containing protein n=1 Tax=Streptomyces rishiriensis TaxID=68264 RepID=UPI0037CE6A35